MRTTSDSLALELRLSLLHERLEAFVDVLGRRDEPERHRLHFQRHIDGSVAAAVQEDLRETDRDRRLFREFLGEGSDFPRESLVRHGLRHEADARGFVRRESGPEEHELFRFRLPEDADEALTPSGPGHKAQIHLRLAELRATRGDPEIACERNLESASEAVPIDRGDRRLWKIRQMAHDLLGPPGEAP